MRHDAGDGGPRRIWFWVGGAVAVLVGIVGTVVWIVSGVRGISDQVDDFQRVPVGGQGTVTLGETGGYTIYYESSDADDLDDADAQVRVVGPGISSGSLGDYDGTLTYTAGGRHGRAVLTLRIDEPGTFTVRATSSGGEGEIAIGRSVGPRLVRTVVGGVLLGLYGVASGVGIVLLTALRRRDARRAR